MSSHGRQPCLPFVPRLAWGAAVAACWAACSRLAASAVTDCTRRASASRVGPLTRQGGRPR
eukprot:4038198-Lingulodinium_polyedra.AAC.1